MLGRGRDEVAADGLFVQLGLQEHGLGGSLFERAWREGYTEIKESQDMAESVVLHRGPAQGPRSVTMGDPQLPQQVQFQCSRTSRA